ncbi:hypothetical protein R1flu_019217 [Riccia fluitans]|uniref:Reverse transcriptase zinc-binding domain-containing protein n=1 Tax=Riccia fluitans TaxID=41844 RepID=A0ABD1ZI16_9MARC
MKTWTAEEGLLLLPTFKTPQSETTNNILQSWFIFRKFLRLEIRDLALPGSLTFRQLQLLLERYAPRRPFNTHVVFPLLKQLGIQVLTNLADATGNWTEIAHRLNTLGTQLTQVQVEAVEAFQRWLGTVRLGPQKLEHSTSWRWAEVETAWKGWLRPSKFWYSLWDKEESLDDLSAKWPTGNYELTWNSRWKRLWELRSPLRVNLWTWQLLHRAFFTGERAAIMNVAHESCRRCHEENESVSHLFYNCRSSVNRWNQLRNLASKACIKLNIPQGLLEIIDEAIKTNHRGGPLIYILYGVTNPIWEDRNKVVFQSRHQMTPLPISLEQARRQIEAGFNAKSSERRWQQGIKALEEINELISATLQSANSPTERVVCVADRPREASRVSPSASNVSEDQDKVHRPSTVDSTNQPYSMRELATEIDRICINEDLATRNLEEQEIEHIESQSARTVPSNLASSSYSEMHTGEWRVSHTWQFPRACNR